MLQKLITGRLNRRQYITRYLLVIVATIVISIVLFSATGISALMTSGTADEAAIEAAMASITPVMYFLGFIMMLVTLVLDLKRFHDMNMGTKWILIPAVIYALQIMPFFQTGIPAYILSIASLVLLLYLCATKGDEGPNQFGNPS